RSAHGERVRSTPRADIRQRTPPLPLCARTCLARCAKDRKTFASSKMTARLHDAIKWVLRAPTRQRGCGAYLRLVEPVFTRLEPAASQARRRYRISGAPPSTSGPSRMAGKSLSCYSNLGFIPEFSFQSFDGPRHLRALLV